MFNCEQAYYDRPLYAAFLLPWKFEGLEMPITTTRRTWIDGGIIIAAAGALIAVGALRQSVQDNGQHCSNEKEN